ncbi:MAG: XdhC/CoxI family protein [Thermomicrobiales bacterium]
MAEDSRPTIFDRVQELVAARIPVAVATVVRGDGIGSKLLVLPDGVEGEGSFANLGFGQVVEAAAREALRVEKSGVHVFGATEVFIDVYPLPPQLIIIGAVHVAQALATLARTLGFRVIVVDARSALATRERFPDADEIVVTWPDDAFATLQITPKTFIAILTHDPKFDEPAILGALATDALYIGAIGSRKTNEDRRERLLAAGVTEEQIARLRGPIGLDLGGGTPEEMALSIAAEMIAVKNGRSGGSLRQATGRIRADG